MSSDSGIQEAKDIGRGREGPAARLLRRVVARDDPGRVAQTLPVVLAQDRGDGISRAVPAALGLLSMLLRGRLQSRNHRRRLLCIAQSGNRSGL